MSVPSDFHYRACAGIVLLNRHDDIFVAQRRDIKTDAWQMPQGGIHDDEEPLTGALRELEEETSIPSHCVTVLGSCQRWYYYDLPPPLIKKLWNGRFIGQKQKWFALRFHGDDSHINLDTSHPEFTRWRWASPNEVIECAISFKRETYTRVFAELRQRAILK